MLFASNCPFHVPTSPFHFALHHVLMPVFSPSDCVLMNVFIFSQVFWSFPPTYPLFPRSHFPAIRPLFQLLRWTLDYFTSSPSWLLTVFLDKFSLDWATASFLMLRFFSREPKSTRTLARRICVNCALMPVKLIKRLNNHFRFPP